MKKFFVIFAALIAVLSITAFATANNGKHKGNNKAVDPSFVCSAGLCTFSVSGVTQAPDTEMWVSIKFTPDDPTNTITGNGTGAGCNSGVNTFVNSDGTVSVTVR